MNKILSFGALSMGISAQSFGNASPCAAQNRVPINGQAQRGPCAAPQNNVPITTTIDEPVDAPCGCAQSCPTPPRANLPVQQNCCMVAMPCGGRNNSPMSQCNTAPKKIVGAKADNPVCSHVRFIWSQPDTCSETEGPSQYQIRVKTKSDLWRELNAIPGSFTVYRVSNEQLKAGPFNLAPGTIVEWQIRSWDSYGWSEWADGNEADLPKKNLSPGVSGSSSRRRAQDPNQQCVNSWWNGTQCWSPSMVMNSRNAAPLAAAAPVVLKGNNAVIEECPAHNLPTHQVRRVGRVANRAPMRQQMPNWNVLQQTCCRMPQNMIPQSCGCGAGRNSVPIAQPNVDQVELPAPVEEVKCTSNCPAAGI